MCASMAGGEESRWTSHESLSSVRTGGTGSGFEKLTFTPEKPSIQGWYWYRMNQKENQAHGGYTWIPNSIRCAIVIDSSIAKEGPFDRFMTLPESPA